MAIMFREISSDASLRDAESCMLHKCASSITKFDADQIGKSCCFACASWWCQYKNEMRNFVITYCSLLAPN